MTPGCAQISGRSIPDFIGFGPVDCTLNNIAGSRWCICCSWPRPSSRHQPDRATETPMLHRRPRQAPRIDRDRIPLSCTAPRASMRGSAASQCVRPIFCSQHFQLRQRLLFPSQWHPIAFPAAGRDLHPFRRPSGRSLPIRRCRHQSENIRRDIALRPVKVRQGIASWRQGQRQPLHRRKDVVSSIVPCEFQSVSDSSSDSGCPAWTACPAY